MTTTDPRTEAEAVANLVRTGAVTPVTTYEATVVALPDRDGATKVVDLEAYAAAPRRTKQTRTVFDARSFALYLHRHVTDKTEIYADVENARVTGIIDAAEPSGTLTAAAGEAGWNDHKIVLQLTLTPSWKAWLKNDGEFLPQEEFAEFAELQAADVHEPSPADLLELAQRMEMTKSVAFEGGQRLQDGQTRLVYKETIAAKAGEHGELDIPTTITLRLKPYIGGPTYAVLARFRYRLRNQHLVLGYVLDRPDLIRELAFADVVRDLRNGTLTIERDGETVENPNGYEAVPAPIFEGRP
jgi:uncharacterized protein YfdQ (DUF2303 family)